MASSFSIDWCSRLKQVMGGSSNIPTDFTFRIAGMGNGKGDVAKEVNAHKIFLAMASPVFNKMFFESDFKEKSAKETTVENTTEEAFKIMVNAIYNVQTITDSLVDKSVHEVFTVLDLVVRYEITELHLAVKNFISTFPVTKDTVLEVAEDAMEYSKIFEDEAEQLLVVCAKFLRPKFRDAKSVLQFVTDNKDKKDALHELQVLMMEVDLNNSLSCNNCQNTPCLDGAGVEPGNFRVGLFVSSNVDSGYWGNGSYLRSYIRRACAIKVGNGYVVLEKTEPLSEAFFNYNTEDYYVMKVHGNNPDLIFQKLLPTFLYGCKK